MTRRANQPHITIAFALGNAEPRYRLTYHNVGFLMADYLAELSEPLPIKIIKNPGFMNEAGPALKKAARYVPPEHILILQDDSDIILGEYKLSFDRGSAGHNGIASIIAALGAKNFWRLRIGIRPDTTPDFPEQDRLQAGDFVLQKISPAHQEILKSVFAQAAEELKTKV